MNSYFEYANGSALKEQPRQVLSLAQSCLEKVMKGTEAENFSHLVIATTCPDMLAPSLGQMIIEKNHARLSNCHAIDIVQGCAGGVTAMILGSQLAALHQSSVLVLQADAARKATSGSKMISQIFGNGAFGCVMAHNNTSQGLLHYKSRQYKDLSEVVTIRLGHDADRVIMEQHRDMATDPRKHLGISIDNGLAIKLLRNAEKFYLEFVEESTMPDVMILHQVNPAIISHLRQVFSKYKTEFVDVAALTGNCGAASVGIALDQVKASIAHKKVLLCSFGTGGVMTAGLWQN